MRKTANKKVGSQAAKKSESKDVDRYLAAVPEPARATLGKVRAMIRAAAPRGATEGISYGMPAFRYNGYLVGYAAFAKHCSFFPGSGSLLKELGKETKDFSISKGTIRFSMDRPLPAALVKRIVKDRVAANDAKGRGKTKVKKSR